MIAVTPLAVPSVTVSTPPGKAVTGNFLSGVTAPPGATAAVTAVQVPGSAAPVQPGSDPVSVTDPTTGTVTGTLDVKANGTYTFVPSSGYIGPVPPVTLTVSSSDSQSKTALLSITVNALLRDGNESPVVPANGAPLVIDLLANALPPAGTTVRISSFTLPGSTTVYPAGSGLVNVADPTTQQPAGAVSVLANGTATFTPAAGFAGQAPAITYTVTGSDGQTSPGALCAIVPSGACICPTCPATCCALLCAVERDFCGRACVPASEVHPQHGPPGRPQRIGVGRVMPLCVCESCHCARWAMHVQRPSPSPRCSRCPPAIPPAPRTSLSAATCWTMHSGPLAPPPA